MWLTLFIGLCFLLFGIAQATTEFLLDEVKYRRRTRELQILKPEKIKKPNPFHITYHTEDAVAATKAREQAERQRRRLGEMGR